MASALDTAVEANIGRLPENICDLLESNLEFVIKSTIAESQLMELPFCYYNSLSENELLSAFHQLNNIENFKEAFEVLNIFSQKFPKQYGKRRKFILNEINSVERKKSDNIYLEKIKNLLKN